MQGDCNVPGLYMLTSVSGYPEIFGSSPPTMTARAPSLCASRTFFTNSHFPRCTSAIQVSDGSGDLSPARQSLGQPQFSAGSRVVVFAAQGTVKEDKGMT